MSLNSFPADVRLPGKHPEGNHFPLPLPSRPNEHFQTAIIKVSPSKETDFVSDWMLLKSSPCCDVVITQKYNCWQKYSSEFLRKSTDWEIY